MIRLWRRSAAIAGDHESHPSGYVHLTHEPVSVDVLMGDENDERWIKVIWLSYLVRNLSNNVNDFWWQAIGVGVFIQIGSLPNF